MYVNPVMQSQIKDSESLNENVMSDGNPNIKAKENRYESLRLISTFGAILAWIIGGGSTLLALFLLQIEGFSGVYSIALIIGGLVSSFGLAALSELILVIVDIEYNTRKNAHN